MKKTTFIISGAILITIFTYFIHQVFSGHFILPQTFLLGPLTVHYYGLTMALAVLAGLTLAKKRAALYNISGKLVDDIIFWLIIGGFIAARFYHVVTEAGYYSRHPLDILKVWQGGLGIYGAIVGGVITLLLYRKISNIQFPISNFLDWLAPSVLLGQIVGRFGNMFNYELYGYPTALPWKMYVPQQFRPADYLNFSFFHPVFLYEALGNLVILVILIYLAGPRALRLRQNSQSGSSKNNLFAGSGSLFFLYLLLYNMLRFCIEFFKIDSQFIKSFRLNDIIGLVLILFSFAALWVIQHRWKNTTNTLP